MKQLLLFIFALASWPMYATPIARTSNNGSSSPPGQVSVSQCCFYDSDVPRNTFYVFGINSTYTLIGVVKENATKTDYLPEAGPTMADIVDYLNGAKTTPEP